MKNKADYTNLRIAHGKDRCANPPRSGPQGGSGGRRGGGSSSQPPSAIEPPEDVSNPLSENVPPSIKEEPAELGADIPSGEVEAST